MASRVSYQSLQSAGKLRFSAKRRPRIQYKEAQAVFRSGFGRLERASNTLKSKGKIHTKRAFAGRFCVSERHVLMGAARRLSVCFCQRVVTHPLQMRGGSRRSFVRNH